MDCLVGPKLYARFKHFTLSIETLNAVKYSTLKVGQKCLQIRGNLSSKDGCVRLCREPCLRLWLNLGV